MSSSVLTVVALVYRGSHIRIIVVFRSSRFAMLLFCFQICVSLSFATILAQQLVCLVTRMRQNPASESTMIILISSMKYLINNFRCFVKISDENETRYEILNSCMIL